MHIHLANTYLLISALERKTFSPSDFTAKREHDDVHDGVVIEYYHQSGITKFVRQTNYEYLAKCGDDDDDDVLSLAVVCGRSPKVHTLNVHRRDNICYSSRIPYVCITVDKHIDTEDEAIAPPVHRFFPLSLFNLHTRTV